MTGRYRSLNNRNIGKSMNQQHEIYPQLLTFTERLNYAFSNQPLSQSKVALEVSKEVKFSQPTLSDLLQGKIKSTKRAETLAKVLNTDYQWLVTGIASTEQTDATSLVNVPLLEDFETYVNIKPRVLIKKPAPHVQLDIRALSKREVNFFNARYIPMPDKGLGNLINEDSPVFFDKSHTLIEDGLSYVVAHGGIIQVRQLYNMPMGSIRVNALDDQYESFVLDINKQEEQLFQVLGMVFAVLNYY